MPELQNGISASIIFLVGAIIGSCLTVLVACAASEVWRNK